MPTPGSLNADGGSLSMPVSSKTHLSIGLAVRAFEQGHRVYFLTLHDLVTRARQARRRDQQHVLLRNVLRADLFLLDELGFLPLEAADATFLFEVVNKRYQASKPTIVTGNKILAQWGEIFPDSTLAVAVLERPTKRHSPASPLDRLANEIGTLAQALGADPSRVMDAFLLDTKLNVSCAYLRPGLSSRRLRFRRWIGCCRCGLACQSGVRMIISATEPRLCSRPWTWLPVR